MVDAPTSPASRLALLAILLALAGLDAQPVVAQLISPGKLSRAHADLEGVANCTQCHALGQRSANDNRCLDCHTPIQARINAGTGFHVTVDAQPCGDCHKEHFGVDFVPVRFDTLAFEHDKTTFALTGAHQDAACRSCHQQDNIRAPDVLAFKGRHDALDRTFLGLLAGCTNCHAGESPHQDQFEARECDDCHVTNEWPRAEAFDHDLARFSLTGRHVDVACENCHTPTRSTAGEPYTPYTGIDFGTCESCHDDNHQGRFGNDCASCHQTTGWHNLTALKTTAFDHQETGFSLLGSHATADCASCHRKPARSDTDIRVTFVGNTASNTYPRLQSTDCLSCHVDFHRREFMERPGGAVCENCHNQHDWFPTTYSIDRHNRESSYELTGAHLATACVSCHNPDASDRPTFAIDDTACQDCHQPDSPHGTQFADSQGATACASCHVTDLWQTGERFDHDATNFPLTGHHRDTDCGACHASAGPTANVDGPAYRGLTTTCRSCHNEDNPHNRQFEERACNDCHTTETFTIASFDHETARFSLTGAHREVACASCHKPETAPDHTLFTRYRPLPTACETCHGHDQ